MARTWEWAQGPGEGMSVPYKPPGTLTPGLGAPPVQTLGAAGEDACVPTALGPLAKNPLNLPTGRTE